MKLNAKLHEEDTDIVIKCKERYILVFEYIRKSFDGLRCNLDKHRDIQKEIVIILVYIVEIIKQIVSRLYFIFCFVINSLRRIKRPCLFIIKLLNKLIQIRLI